MPVTRRTLAFDNRLISPDYVGSMRALVETATKAPCLFLQGASGDLAPIEQYSGDWRIAEKNGRQLGYAVMATLESMLPAGKALSFGGVVESGAALATWSRASFKPSRDISVIMAEMTFDLKSLPSFKEIEKQYRDCNDRVLRERLYRKRDIRKAIGDGSVVKAPLWIWKIGDAFLVGQQNEAYSEFQQQLRKYFPQGPLR